MYQVFCQKSCVQCGAAFQQDTADLFFPQFVHEGREGHFFSVKDQHFRPFRCQCRLFFLVLGTGSHKKGNVLCRLHQFAVQRNLQFAVADDADGIPSIISQPTVQHGVVCQHRADACQNGWIPPPQLVYMMAAVLVGDPLRSSGDGGDFPVGSHGVFHCHIRALRGDVVKERTVKGITFCPKKIFLHLNARCSQDSCPFASYFGIGVTGTDDHFGNACFQKGFCAGRCLAVVTAGFQCDIDGSTFRAGAAVCQSVPLCVESAKTCVPAFADDFAVLDNDRAHQWVGVNGADAVFGKGHGSPHKILFFHFLHFLFRKKITLNRRETIHSGLINP